MLATFCVGKKVRLTFSITIRKEPGPVLRDALAEEEPDMMKEPPNELLY